MQENVMAKVESILDKVPKNDTEKEILKTDLLRSKFGDKKIFAQIMKLLEGTMLGKLLQSLFPMDKMFLSKERNYAIETSKLYMKNKSKDTGTYKLPDSILNNIKIPTNDTKDIGNILGNIDKKSLISTIDECDKFLKINVESKKDIG
jgi:hypothetical protein